MKLKRKGTRKVFIEGLKKKEVPKKRLIEAWNDRSY